MILLRNWHSQSLQGIQKRKTWALFRKSSVAEKCCKLVTFNEFVEWSHSLCTYAWFLCKTARDMRLATMSSSRAGFPTPAWPHAKLFPHLSSITKQEVEDTHPERLKEALASFGRVHDGWRKGAVQAAGSWTNVTVGITMYMKRYPVGRDGLTSCA